MASEIRVNQIQNRSGLSTVTFSDTGAIVSGIVTANSFSGNVTGGTINATSGTITGNLGVGGVLTYEDVTNIDSVGVITARSGVHISGSGSDLTMNSSGAIFTGNGGNATDPIVANVSDTNTGYFYPAADTIAVTTGGSERLRITADGKFGVNTTAPVETVGIAGSMRFITSNGTRRMITALPSGSYATSVSGGSAIGFERIADGGGGSDEIYFETHWQGNRHGESMRINKKGHVTKPLTPFFSVYGTNANVTYNQNDTINFENQIQNVGNHFKMSSGTGQYERFYAPVAGVYLFTFGFFPNAASNCRISLAVNGGVQTNPYISGCFTAWGTGVSVPMGSQMLKLSANDYVSVVVQIGTLTNTYDGHTGFQGILLG